MKIRNNTQAMRVLNLGKGHKQIQIPPGENEIEVPEYDQEAFDKVIKGDLVKVWLEKGIITIGGGGDGEAKEEAAKPTSTALPSGDSGTTATAKKK